MIELTLAALPLADGVAEVAGALGEDAGTFAATAGEDYELCVCLAPEALEALDGSGSRGSAGCSSSAPGLTFTDASASYRLRALVLSGITAEPAALPGTGLRAAARSASATALGSTRYQPCSISSLS